MFITPLAENFPYSSFYYYWWKLYFTFAKIYIFPFFFNDKIGLKCTKAIYCKHSEKATIDLDEDGWWIFYGEKKLVYYFIIVYYFYPLPAYRKNNNSKLEIIKLAKIKKKKNKPFHLKKNNRMQSINTRRISLFSV